MKVQDFFTENNNGKTPQESVLGGETFTAHQMVEFAKKWKSYKLSKKTVDPCYVKFIDIWNRYFPNLLDFPRDAKHFKSLISKTHEMLLKVGKETSEDMKCNSFEFVVKWCKQSNHFASGKPVGFFDSQYKSIIYEMKTGKKKDNFNNQNSSERAFSNYA